MVQVDTAIVSKVCQWGANEPNSGSYLFFVTKERGSALGG
jgi:hypothetical protein